MLNHRKKRVEKGRYIVLFLAERRRHKQKRYAKTARLNSLSRSRTPVERDFAQESAAQKERYAALQIVNAGHAEKNFISNHQILNAEEAQVLFVPLNA